MARTLKRSLSRLAVHVRTVHTAHDLERFLKSREGVVFAIVDVKLSEDVTAFEVFRQCLGGRVPFPVVFITAYADELEHFLVDLNALGGRLVSKNSPGFWHVLCDALGQELGSRAYEKLALSQHLQCWHEDPQWVPGSWRRELAHLMIDGVPREQWVSLFPELGNRNSLNYRRRQTLQPFHVTTVEDFHRKMEREGRDIFRGWRDEMTHREP